MILTGKAKKDFEKWLNKEMYYLGRHNFEDRDNNIEDLSDNFQNALIIDFFDSVGIYINIENLYYQSWWSYKVKIIPNIFEEEVMVKTRQEATEQAIKKANEIYNSN